MALLFTDSVDGINATADIEFKWGDVPTGGYGSYSATGGRFGGGAILHNGYSAQCRLFRTLATEPTTVIIGVSTKGGIPAGRPLFLFSNSSGGVNCVITVDANGAIEAFRGDYGGTSLGKSSNGVIKLQRWHRVEAKVTIDSAVGAVEVRVDEVTVLNLTSQNTQDTAIAAIGLCGIGGWTASYNVYNDDIIIMDTAGPHFNDFIGDVRIYSALPDADGSQTDFTPLSGTVNYAMVDDLIDTDTSYVYSTTSGHIDLYSFGALGLGASDTIAGLAITNIARKDDIGSRSIRSNLVSGTATSTGSSFSLSSDNTYFGVVDQYPIDPNTSTAWNGTDVDNIEAGPEVSG